MTETEEVTAINIEKLREALEHLPKVADEGLRRMVGTTLTEVQIRELDRIVLKHKCKSRMEFLRRLIVAITEEDGK